MSSTSIVIKCLADARQNNSPHGQITIGTLILQVSPPFSPQGSLGPPQPQPPSQLDQLLHPLIFLPRTCKKYKYSGKHM